jgi:hypothetical protein
MTYGSVGVRNHFFAPEAEVSPDKCFAFALRSNPEVVTSPKMYDLWAASQGERRAFVRLRSQ